MYDRSDILPSQKATIAEVADYVVRNPSLQIGIDNTADPRGSDPRDPDLNQRRADAVRDALVQAGVPAGRIQTGIVGDGQLARDRRVGLLVSTAR
jgi:OOP family OmpA-OmpF porin